MWVMTRTLTNEDCRRNYAKWAREQRIIAEHIKESSEARKYLLKNITIDDPWTLLWKACEVIALMTEDAYFENFMREQIRERKETS
ncbi:MAG: hypothetical protein J6O00_09505 [Clostridiales bacterium]|nr:hypothetical protein [Clostridiales bacterium]